MGLIMTQVSAIGVQSCNAGWLAVHEHGGDFDFVVEKKFADLAKRFPRAFVGINLPIGLLDEGVRNCDSLARKRMGEQGNTIQDAPLRPTLAAQNNEEANELRKKIDGQKYSESEWQRLLKIREVDEVVMKDENLRGRIYEVHPELSFAHLNYGKPISGTITSVEGREARINALVSAWRREWIDEMLARVEKEYSPDEVAPDDLINAIACLWSTQRVLSDQAGWVGDLSVRDSAGLPMAIYI